LKLLEDGGFWTPSEIGINKRDFEVDMVGMGEISGQGRQRGILRAKLMELWH